MSDPLLEAYRALADDDVPAWMSYGDRSAAEADGLPYSTPHEHRQMVLRSRWLAHNHPFACAALELRAAYIVGSGHHYTLAPRRQNETIATNAAIETALDVLDAWSESQRWPLVQREIQLRLDRDGEAWVYLDPDTLHVRLIDALRITGPMRPSDEYEAYGLRLHDGDPYRIEGYWLDGEQLLPPTNVQFRKANVDAALPRGVPVLWPARESLRRAWHILRAASTVAGIQAAIAAVVQRRQGAGVSAWIDPSVDPGAAKDAEGRTVQQLPPGAILQLRPGEEWQTHAGSLNVANFAAAIQAELRAVAARLCLPEYMLTADASNANYSSTLVAEGPAVKTFERLQAEMIWYDLWIIRRVLRRAEERGELPPGFTRAIRIEAEAPTVQSRNRLAEAQADQILLASGVVSPQTIARRHGFDPDVEQAQLEQLREKQPDSVL